MKNNKRKRRGVFSITILFLAMIITPTAWSTKTEIVWDVTISLTTPDVPTETVVFGEAPDANDGPPADDYDLIKPPPPPLPNYIQAFFKDGLPIPYDKLWYDFRQYPDTEKTWNLSVQWIPENGESPTIITLSWNTDEIEESEYTTMNLCTNQGMILTDMLVNTTYSFTCPAYIPQNFKIICSMTINQPPTPPLIKGPTKGNTGVATEYIFTATDPENNQIFYYIDWGDGTNSGWIGPYTSGIEITKEHTWSKKGTYTIKAKAKDTHGNEGDWGTLSVTMPYSYNIPFQQFWEKFFERFPQAFPILRRIVGY